jgi:putative hemolysin
MILFNIELVVITISLLFLFYLSLVESAITQSSPLALRMMVERQDKSASPFLLDVLENKMQILVPLHFGIQISVITISVLSAHSMLTFWPQYGVLYSFAAIILISISFRQLLPWLLTQNDPEIKLINLLKIFGPAYVVLRFLSMPMSRILNTYIKLREKDENTGEPGDEDPNDQEMQAYLEIGEDEGILQEEDTKLIQSVVEFGTTLVREVMTPRTKIVACNENATIGELRETMVQHRHSRIPVFKDDIDHIIGVVYIRRLMAEYVKGMESDPITGLINPVLFVPGTKRVAKLLKELQERGDHAAIVIDEFGGVAGLVTIEDLVEEIIGDIRDEDEAKVSKIIEEGPRNYVVRGSTELSRLEELSGREFDNMNCSTVAGLVMAYLGRVPAPGEVFDLKGISVRILDADRRRVHWVRIQLPEIKESGAGSQESE